MRSGLRLAVIFVSFVTGLIGLSGTASGEGASSLDGLSTRFSPSLVVPSVEPLVGGQQAAAEEARRTNPEAATARQTSSSAYEGLSAEAAEQIAHDAFPRLSDDPAGGPPQLQAGERITGFPSDFAASVAISGGRHGVIESLTPIALGDSSGRTPVDLSLREAGGAFRPTTPVVQVRLPSRLSEGASLPGIGVSLTPVDERGSALNGARGAIDGASVFYGQTEGGQTGVKDVDTLVKPNTSGFSEETLLRSQRSPRKLFFKIGLPQGASLTQAGDGTVEVINAGGTIASIPRPYAYDAEGTLVPVSVGLSGNVLVLTVDHKAGQFRMPIAVDPSLFDMLLTTSGVHKTNWHYVTSVGAKFFSATEHPTENKWTIQITGSHTETESGALWYTTQGASSITSFSVEGSGETTGSHVETLLEIVKPPKVEGEKPERESFMLLSEKWSGSPNIGKPFGAGNNSALFQQQSLKAGGGVGGETTLTKASVTIEQEKGAEVSFDKTSPTVDGGQKNILYGAGAWIGPNSGGAFEIHAKDPGIGISFTGISSGSWAETFPTYEKGECTGGIQCPPAFNKGWIYNNKWSDGEDTFEANACDAAELPATCGQTGAQKIKVDSAAPHGIAISGLGAGNEIGAGEYHLKVEAVDGSGTTPSSGIKSIVLLIDGRETGSPSGSCSVSAGPCTAHGEWTIAGRNYATGKHIFTIVATDNAANVEKESYTVTVRPATPVGLGPGSLNPQSGELTVSATDVSMGGGLTVSRSYNSRHPSAGAQGPFGAQWGTALGGKENAVKQPNGSVVLTDASGAQTIFTTNGEGGFISPAGDEVLKLSTTPCEVGKTEYMLKNLARNSWVCYRVPSGGSGEVLAPSFTQGTIASDVVKYSYETAEVPVGSGKKFERPKEALAPAPVGVTCSIEVKANELKHGCRALTFNYAETTTATGENQAQWGDYRGQMTRVYYTAYDPVSKTMLETTVAHYLYDAQGRLRAEWDPRITPELKKVYGYDAEGHVTALTPPGQESWAITYGSVAGDVSSGRVLKVNRAPASASLWGGEPPKNVETPRITGTPAVGVRLAVSDGKWLGSPVSYAYQWEDCNTSGSECVPIAGATNPNYTPSDSDVFHVLKAVVTATNGGGSVKANGSVLFSAGVTTEFSLPAGSNPVSSVTGPDGNLWFTDRSSSKIGKITMAGAITEYALPAGSHPVGITAGPDGNVWFTDESTAKVGKITTAGVITEYALPAGSLPYGIVTGPDKNLWLAEYGTGKVARVTTAGTITEWWALAGAHPYSMTVGSDGNLWFTDRGETNAVMKLTTTGIMTEYALPSVSNPGQIAAGSDGNLWFTDKGTSKISKITTAGTITEYSLPAGSGTEGITAGSDKNLWFTDNSTSKLGRITTSGTITETSLPAGSHPYWIATGPDGNPWFVNYETNKVGKITISGISAITEYALPAASTSFDVTSGSDGNLWFTNYANSKVGKSTTAGTITEYALPAGSSPVGITGGSDKNLWFADFATSKIGKITTAGVITEYALPAGSESYGITSGPDGNLWFTDYGTSKIGKITTAGVITEYALPAGSKPIGIITGSDGKLWFTDRGTNKVGKITTTGTITEYSVPAGSEPYAIMAGPDGNLWFTNYGSMKVGKITTSGTVTEYALPATSKPARITVGSDGNLWFTDYGTSKIGKITTAGAITEYTFATGSAPAGITSGPDGNLWFSDGATNKIGKIVTSASEYALPGGSRPEEITSGPDGNLWFTNFESNKIGKATTSGTVVEYSLAAGSKPYGIATGLDGNLWFTNYESNKIGRITTSGTVTEYSVPLGSKPARITPGPDGNLWFTDEGTSKVGKITPSGTITEYGLPAGSKPKGITYGPDGNLWFTNSETGKIGKITTSGTITEYVASGVPSGITSGPDGNLWFANYGTSKIGKITTAGSITEYALPTGSEPNGIAYGSDGNLWFTDTGTSKIGKITTAGTISEYAFPTNSLPKGIVSGPDNNLWFTNGFTNKLGKISPQVTAGESRTPAPGSTVEYNVPLSGAGLPTMTSAEVKKWGQEDIPVEAAAVFPPDEKQSWPATDYKRASISYFDARGRTVNVSTANGGVSTTEYTQANESNDVVRTLTPDNRAAALKEGAKSVEVSKLLDTQSTYNSEGTELLSTLGPRHLVKLSSGSEVQARNHTVYSYDEGAPAEGGPYRLVTKLTQGAQVEGEADQDVRTTITSYSGQEGLGWKLRRPTSVTADPNGLKITHMTVFDPTTDNVVETLNAAGTTPPVFASQFGSAGSGNGQFNRPESVATDGTGNIWVDDKENGRLQKFSATGEFIAAYGTAGSGAGQFSGAWGITINKSTNNVYVADELNNRVDELNSTGTFLRTFGFGVTNGEEKLQICTASCRAGTAGTGNGQMKEPTGVQVDASGNVWVADYGNNRVQEFTATGEFVSVFGSKGSGNGQFNEPGELAFSAGNLYVTDQANHRVQEFSTSGTYLGQFGKLGTGPGQFEEPWGISTDPSTGDLYVVDSVEHGRVEKFNPHGVFLTEFGGGALTSPTGVIVNSGGEILVTEQYSANVSKWTPAASAPAYSSAFGSSGSGGGQFSYPVAPALDGAGHVWVTDFSNNRVEKFSESGTYSSSIGTSGTAGGQFANPTGIWVNQTSGNIYVIDHGNNRVEEFNSSGTFVRTFGFGVSDGVSKFEVCTTSCHAGIAGSGAGQLSNPDGLAIDSAGNVWVADEGNNRVVEYSSTGTYVAEYGSLGTGNVQSKQPVDLTVDGGYLFVADTGNDRIEELSTSGGYVGQFGSAGSGAGQFNSPETIATGPEGNLYVADFFNSRIEELTPSGAYLSSFGSHGSGIGQLSEPEGIAINPSGEIYVADSGDNRVEKWSPHPRPGAEGARDTRTIYYTAAGEAEVEACRNHPEWAGLACQTQPSVQPETSGLPALPVTTVTSYNMLFAPLTTVSKSGASTRTWTNTYDGAGRLETAETTSTVGTTLPKITNKYDSTTGSLAEESMTVKGKTQSLKSVYNKLGEITSYTDADGNVSLFEYEPEKDDRLTKVNDGQGIQTYTYDETTGQIKEVIDSAAGTFVPAYDVEGQMTSETYPGGLKAIYTRDPAGNTTSVVYKKETHCTENCEWFKDSMVPSIHGQWMTQTSSFGKEAYEYDGVGHLTQAQATPVGKGCATRRYVYDEDANRRSLTSYEPNVKGECATETPSLEEHTYDSADRLVDAGISYDAYGNTTSLSPADAGKFTLTSSFYVNNRLASSEQNGQTIGYNLDPAERTREIVSTGTVVASEIQHYTGAGSRPAWTAETSGKFTRYISGLSGLAAIQHTSETPVLQITNLHGDIVATVADSETAPGLASTIKEASEYGVPGSEAPPRYSWLGAHEIPTELPSGVTGMGARSYVPEIGRFLQKDPVAGGSNNPYAYTNGDPMGETDLTGMYVEASYASGYENEGSQRAAEAEAAREAVARAEAEARAAWAAYEAEVNASIEAEGDEWEGEEEEEEEEEEEIGLKRGGPGGEPYAAEGLVWRPFSELAEGEDAGEASADSSLCKGEQSTPCSELTRRKKKKSKKKKTGTLKNGECKIGVHIYVPGDSAAGCCNAKKPLEQFGEILDCYDPNKMTGGSVEYKSPLPRPSECPEGTTPGIGPNGVPSCLLDGDERPEWLLNL
jgi:RHS repeat-associated protein